MQLKNENLIFERKLDLKHDTYLLDHKISGISFVPAAIGASMIICAAQLQSGQITQLQDFKVNSPIMVKDKIINLIMRSEKRKNSLQIKISNPILAFSGTATRIFKNKKIIKNFGKVIQEKEPRDFGSSGPLFFGPNFHSIDKVLITSKKETIMRIKNDKLRTIFDAGIYSKLTQWIDASIQAVGGVGNIRFKVFSLPISISKITSHFENDISNILYIIPEKVTRSKEHIKGNAFIVNDKKEVILELENIRLKIFNKNSIKNESWTK
jgi:hypothetical protein